jgi:phage host-nuclease inhibitor protein Gam
MSTPVVSQSWLQRHERIVIAFFILSLGIYGFNRWADKSANDAKTQQAIAQQVQASQDKTAALLKAQVDAQSAQFAQSQAEMKQEILSLVSAIAQRDAAAQSEVAEVSLPKTPSQAVTDLQVAYTNLPATIGVTDTGAVVPTSDLQVFTVTKIQSDTCSADLADTKSELADSQRVVSQSESLITNLQSEVIQDAIDLKSHDAAAAAELKTVKAQARKSKFKIFWVGVVTGFLGRSAIK